MIIGISGKAGVGKDALTDVLQTTYLTTRRYAFGDEIKEIAVIYFGWNHDHTHGSLKDVVVPVEFIPENRSKLRERLAGIAHSLSLDPFMVCEAFFNALDSFAARGSVSPREVFQFVGTEVGRAMDPEFWVKTLMNKIEFDTKKTAKKPLIFVTDVRFDSEARAIRRTGGKVMLIIRKEGKQVLPHASENGVHADLINVILNNDSDLDSLHVKAELAVDHWL
jgi:hypothetical protein